MLYRFYNRSLLSHLLAYEIEKKKRKQNKEKFKQSGDGDRFFSFKLF